jgi:uncharacterized phiE125 gp8 family phage protein
MTYIRETRTTAPAKLAVDIQQAKSYLKVADSDVDGDALISGFLSAGVEACEKFTGKALITQTWTGFLDYWPTAPSENIWEGVRQVPVSLAYGGPGELVLPRGPLQSVTSMETFDDADVATVFPAASYFVDTASTRARVTLRTGIVPPLPTRHTNGIKLVYVVGYGDDAADVPEELRLGILALVSHLNEHRGDDDVSLGSLGGGALPGLTQMLWAPYRVARV